MKKMFASIAGLLCGLYPVSAGWAQIPLEAHGVWDRDHTCNPQEYPFIRGLTFNEKWREIEKSPGVFDWSELDAALKKACEHDIWCYGKINVGPDSPDWIYEKGVPKVTTSDEEHTGKWNYYPYYLDPGYRRFYFRLIEQFARRIYSYPPEQQRHIAFIQVQTGCTGDECAYKGKPGDARYELPKGSPEWQEFRLAAFKKFNEVFQEAPEKKIPLLFNSVGGDATGSKGHEQEWKWVLEHVKGGIGIKNGALSRGHHLKNEREVYEQWISYLVNPKGLRLFRRSEMDQTWKKPWYQLNLPLNFYWGAINALNAGQSVWDVNPVAIEASKQERFGEAFHFFTKYAGQIYPADATDAFCALHKGLDASDTLAYPESEYGEATSRNTDRMLAICKRYERYGAKVDDVDALLMGQVRQRRSQKGFNDVGWRIWPENYERFLHQIDPDETSIPLWRLGGAITGTSPVYCRFARGFEHAGGKDAMYFKLQDDFFRKNAPGTLTVRIVWYDQIPGSRWELRYDAGKDNMKTALTITGEGDEKWKEHTATLRDAVMQHNGPRGCDLALVNTDATDDVFSIIEVHRELTHVKRSP